jgi:hypothetical protein
MGSRSHNAGAFSAIFFEGGESSMDIELELATAAAIASLDHHDDGLLNPVGLS